MPAQQGRRPISSSFAPVARDLHGILPSKRGMNKMHKIVAVMGCLSAAMAVLAGAAEKPQSLTVNADRIQQHITALSQFGTNPEGGVSRVAFSDADIAGRKYVSGLMQETGLTLRTDAAGHN